MLLGTIDGVVVLPVDQAPLIARVPNTGFVPSVAEIQPDGRATQRYSLRSLVNKEFGERDDDGPDYVLSESEEEEEDNNDEEEVVASVYLDAEFCFHSWITLHKAQGFLTLSQAQRKEPRYSSVLQSMSQQAFAEVLEQCQLDCKRNGHAGRSIMAGMCNPCVDRFKSYNDILCQALHHNLDVEDPSHVRKRACGTCSKRYRRAVKNDDSLIAKRIQDMQAREMQPQQVSTSVATDQPSDATEHDKDAAQAKYACTKTILIATYDESGGDSVSMLEQQCVSLVESAVNQRGKIGSAAYMGCDFGAVIPIVLVDPCSARNYIATQLLPYLFNIVRSDVDSFFNVVFYVTSHGCAGAISSVGGTFEAGLKKTWDAKLCTYIIFCEKFVQTVTNFVNHLSENVRAFHFHFSSCHSLCAEITHHVKVEKGGQEVVDDHEEQWWYQNRWCPKDPRRLSNDWVTVSGFGQAVPCKQAHLFDEAEIIPKVLMNANMCPEVKCPADAHLRVVTILRSIVLGRSVQSVNKAELWDLKSGYFPVERALYSDSVRTAMLRFLRPSENRVRNKVVFMFPYRDYEDWLFGKGSRYTGSPLPAMTVMHWNQRVSTLPELSSEINRVAAACGPGQQGVVMTLNEVDPEPESEYSDDNSDSDSGDEEDRRKRRRRSKTQAKKGRQ